jgi:hypothetical protein
LFGKKHIQEKQQKEVLHLFRWFTHTEKNAALGLLLANSLQLGASTIAHNTQFVFLEPGNLVQ